MNIKPDNIPSVHNYCDRWCERCRFVDRCAIGSSEKLLAAELAMDLAMTEEKRQEIMWKHVADSFAEAGRLLEKMILEAGLDIEEIKREAKENPYVEPKLTNHQEAIKELTENYGKEVHDWMRHNPALFEVEALMSRVLVQPDDPEKFMLKTKDAIETVNWFCFFISVKSQRALSGKQEDDYEEEEDLLQSDFNGSAKIALIAIGRSVEAWEFLLKAFPEMESVIIGYLAQLQKISRYLLIEFPDAPKFIRPGFDETKYDHVQPR